jgi:hypothetical protein
MWITKISDNEFELHRDDCDWDTLTREELAELVGSATTALLK